MQERALTVEHFRHVCAQRLGARQDNGEKQRDLKNPNASHKGPSKLLRPEQGVDQVREQPQRCDTGNDVIHISPLKACRRLW
jgi:hypothetical protein